MREERMELDTSIGAAKTYLALLSILLVPVVILILESQGVGIGMFLDP